MAITPAQKNFIESFCYQFNIKNYKINADGSIDVDGDVRIHNTQLTELP